MVPTPEEVLKFGKTWNINLRILLDLPRNTHCWIVEDLTDGRHLRQMIMSRFLKYIKSLAKNKMDSVRCLYKICKDDIRTTTGSNIRTILLETQKDPRKLNVHALKKWRVYKVQDDWTVPLLRNLMQVRGDNWEVVYDAENDVTAEDDDINFIIEAICTA